MDMRGLVMVGGALSLMAAPVAWKVMQPVGDEPTATTTANAEPAADDAPKAEPERREVAGGAVFVTARE